MKLPFGYFIGKMPEQGDKEKELRDLLKAEQLERENQKAEAIKVQEKLKIQLKLARDSELERKRAALTSREELAFSHLKIAERYYIDLHHPNISKSRKASLISIITDRVEAARAIGLGISGVDQVLKKFDFI